MSVSVSLHERDNDIVLNVAGEVDVSTASQLRDALNAALERGSSKIEVDLSDAPYIDSTGIGVLVGAALPMRVSHMRSFILSAMWPACWACWA